MRAEARQIGVDLGSDSSELEEDSDSYGDAHTSTDAAPLPSSAAPRPSSGASGGVRIDDYDVHGIGLPLYGQPPESQPLGQGFPPLTKSQWYDQSGGMSGLNMPIDPDYTRSRSTQRPHFPSMMPS